MVTVCLAVTYRCPGSFGQLYAPEAVRNAKYEISTRIYHRISVR